MVLKLNIYNLLYHLECLDSRVIQVSVTHDRICRHNSLLGTVSTPTIHTPDRTVTEPAILFHICVVYDASLVNVIIVIGI